MTALKFRTGYDFSFGDRADVDFGDEPSLTIQSAADECDINLIIDRANRGMLSDHVNNAVPKFGDVSEIVDYQSALNLVMDAQDQFGKLPSKIRDRFQNNPALLLAFLGDPANRDEAIRLGLVDAPELAPVSAPVLSETEASAPNVP